MKSVVKLPKFKKGKYSFCREKRCELQEELRDGDPAHQECWLCIRKHYSKKPKLSDLKNTNQIIQLRKTKNDNNISKCK